MIKIKCSKHNEVRLSDVKAAVGNNYYIKKSEYNIGEFVGWGLLPNKKSVKVYSNDWVYINNVILPLAKGEEEYFCCELTIN